MMDLTTFMSAAPPRAREDEFLDPGRRRIRQSRRFLAGFFGVMALFMVPMLFAVAANAGPNKGFIGPAACVVLGTLLVAGVPVYLWGRQDITVGRRLLREGVLTDARATLASRTPLGSVVLWVAMHGEGEPRELAFRVPIVFEEAQALVGQSLPLLWLPSSPRAVGIVIEGHGLVTTR